MPDLYLSCGCIVPMMEQPEPCHVAHRPMAELSRTCIRDVGAVSLCGRIPTSSVGGAHYAARLTSPAVAWHLEHIPGGLCAECVRVAG